MNINNLQAGDLRTKIRIQRYVKPTGGDDFAEGEWVDLCDENSTIYPFIKCAWYPLGGAETWIADSVQVSDGANVIIRYNPSVTSQCRLIRDGVNYNIIGPNDPDQHKRWMKFKVKAAINGG